MGSEWVTFIGSIIGGIIGGLFTYLGVLITIKHNDNQNRVNQYKNDYNNRPRFEIIDYKDCNSEKGTFSDTDILVLHIENFSLDQGMPKMSYSLKNKSDTNLVCFEYVLRNIGLTEIDNVTIATNFPKSTSLCKLENKNYYFDNGVYSCSVDSKKRFIKPNDTFVIRFYYANDQIKYGVISHSVSLFIQDINGNFWHQPFNPPYNEIENTRRISYKEMKSLADNNVALDCFCGKKYW